jgi:hypothetical protein
VTEDPDVVPGSNAERQLAGEGGTGGHGDSTSGDAQPHAGARQRAKADQLEDPPTHPPADAPSTSGPQRGS